MTISVSWYDYRINIPIATIAASDGSFIKALRSQDFFDGGINLPDNMLGDARDQTGLSLSDPGTTLTIDPTTGALVGVVFKGRPGQAAFSYTDPGGNTVNVAQVGDPTLMYLHIRAPFSPAQLTTVLISLGKTLGSFGVQQSDPTLSAQLLGVWA